VTNRHLFLQAATTSQYVTRIVELQMERVGLPAYLLALLTHVRDLDPASPSAISEASGVPMTTLRDNIQRLVDRELARRVSNPRDGRSYLVKITARGRAALRRADPALLEAYLALERHLPQPRERYEELFDELNEALELALGDLSPADSEPAVDRARRN
jgi:DNA-binding MarR family transcriptional regulator